MYAATAAAPAPTAAAPTNDFQFRIIAPPRLL
jgi:hypothetical protein